MDARFYNSEAIDIERLANDVTNVYTAQGYQTQQIGNKDQMLVQLKKGGDLEALVGMQAAVSLTLQRMGNGVMAMIGQQKWLDKAAVGTIGIVAFPILWPLALTAKLWLTGVAADQLLLPACDAVIEQVPELRKVRLPPPVTLQTVGVVEAKVTARPDVAVAVSVGEVP